MSYNAVPPPPGIIHGTMLGNGQQSNNTETQFAKPMLPPARLGSAATAPRPTKKRKSRFSDAPPSSEAPPLKILQIMPAGISNLQTVESLGINSKKAALVSAAAARINANLLAQGKIKSLPQDSQLTSPSTAPTASILSDIANPVQSAEIKRTDDMYATEVEINDIPVGCRNYLTRLSTQENINKSYSAYVSTRGKYMSPDEKKQSQWLMGNDKPLYLFVQSQLESNVKKALDRIKQIINNHFEKKSKFQSEALAQIASLNQKVSTISSGSMPNPISQSVNPDYPLHQAVTPLPHFQPALPSGNYMQEKLFIGLDGIPDHFDLKNKLLGPNYRNFTFIANQTGAKVILRGKGSGFLEPTSGREAFESMYAFISHPNQAGVDAAKRLVSNLIDTLKTELGPHLRLSQITQSSGYNAMQLQGAYRMVSPPSQMPVPLPGVQATPYAAYPFQQQPTAPVTSASIQDQSQSNHKYGEDSNVLGYQHNFAGKEKNNSRSSSRSSKSKEKSRKRFTEELPTPSTKTTNNEKADATQQNDSETLDVNNFKMPSLPFWMTP